MNIKHYELHDRNAPWNGEIRHITNDEAFAANWERGPVVAVAEDGTEHDTRRVYTADNKPSLELHPRQPSRTG